MAVNLSNREKYLGLVTGGVAICYFFYVLMFAPLLESRSKLKNNIVKAQTELKLSETKIKLLESVEKEADRARSRRLSNFSEGDRALEVLRRLSFATSRSDLALLMVKPLESKAGEGIRFEMNCSGSFAQLHDFLNGIFNSEVIMLVDSMTIKGGGSPAPMLDIGLQVTSFF